MLADIYTFDCHQLRQIRGHLVIAMVGVYSLGWIGFTFCILAIQIVFFFFRLIQVHTEVLLKLITYNPQLLWLNYSLFSSKKNLCVLLKELWTKKVLYQCCKHCPFFSDLHSVTVWLRKKRPWQKSSPARNHLQYVKVCKTDVLQREGIRGRLNWVDYSKIKSDFFILRSSIQCTCYCKKSWILWTKEVCMNDVVFLWGGFIGGGGCTVCKDYLWEGGGG